MRGAWLIVPSLLMLGACGDPLADIERVTDDTFAQDTTRATALPTEAELERKESILSGLFRQRADVAEAPTDLDTAPDAQGSDATSPVPAAELAQDAFPVTDADSINAAVQTALASEQDPKPRVLGWLRRASAPVATPVISPAEDTPADAAENTASPSDAPVVLAETDSAQTSETDVLLPAEGVEIAALPEDLSDGSTQAKAVAPEKRRWLFGGLARRASADVAAQDHAAAATLAEEEVQIAALPAEIATEPTRTDAVAPEKRRWLFGGLAKRSSAEVAGQEDASGAVLSEEEVQIAALPEEIATEPTRTDAVAPERKRRLFGGRTTRPTAGMALADVGLNADLPFGEVARVCDVSMDALGTRVEQSDPSNAGYGLYDSAPDSAAPRSFYVTGFSDNCVRQFTASLAVFGTPKFHEQLRYGLPAEEYPYSTTDRAYEKVKAKLCNVGRNTPCGEQISKLEKTTIFISAYEHFRENARWADMLLHNGALLAKSVKTP